MDFLHQRFTCGDVDIEFSTEDIYSLLQPSSSDLNSIWVLIYIRKENKILSIYSRLFPKTVSAVHYLNFVKKFITNPSYRKTYIVNGYTHWEGAFRTSSSPIHPECKKMIEELNSKETIKFKDLVKLKTFGRDSLSSMGAEKLKEVVSTEGYTFIAKESESEHITLSALRWIARGLLPQHALYKARVDAEIERNKQNSSNFIL